MSDQEQIEGIESEISAMLQILQHVHDEASMAMYHPTHGMGAEFRLERHKLLQTALDTIREELKEDWSYTP